MKKYNSKWGISTSPHADQDFLIQDPYYPDNDGMCLLLSDIYPFRHDSLGFPSMMASIAKRLNQNATYRWTDVHYLIDVTLNGHTKTYGGAGNGGGQGIRKSDIKYYYRFDGTASDNYRDKNLSSINRKICEYGKLNIPEDEKEGKITWDDISRTVGEGSYVKVGLFTSLYFGVTGTGFSYMYDKGYSKPGYISNAWYDGRYFNKWEYFYPGAVLEETAESEQASLVFKDYVAKIPDNGQKYLYHNKDIGADIYDSSTGVWKGYTYFIYDSETKTWKADFLNAINYYSEEDYQYHEIDDQDFIDACTITMDEANSMEIDCNTNIDPSTYYAYDMKEEPGTYHKGN